MFGIFRLLRKYGLGKKRIETGDEFEARILKLWSVLEERGWQKKGILGKGVNGTVYTITHPVDGERAIKFPHKLEDADDIEVKILELLSGKGIAVEIFYYPVLPNEKFFVMQKMPLTLKSILKNTGNMSRKDILDIVTKIVLCIDEMHKMGVVHFDVKPDNIGLDEKGKNPRFFDFGLANCLNKDGSWRCRHAWKGPVYPPYEYHTLATNRGGSPGFQDDFHGVIVILGVFLLHRDAWKYVHDPSGRWRCNSRTQTRSAKRRMLDVDYTARLIWAAIDDPKAKCKQGVLELIHNLRTNTTTRP